MLIFKSSYGHKDNSIISNTWDQISILCLFQAIKQVANYINHHNNAYLVKFLHDRYAQFLLLPWHHNSQQIYSLPWSWGSYTLLNLSRKIRRKDKVMTKSLVLYLEKKHCQMMMMMIRNQLNNQQYTYRRQFVLMYLPKSRYVIIIIIMYNVRNCIIYVAVKPPVKDREGNKISRFMVNT